MGSFNEWLNKNEGLMDVFNKQPDIRNPITVCIEFPQMDPGRIQSAQAVLAQIIKALGGQFKKSAPPNAYHIIVPDAKSAKYLAGKVKNGIVVQDKLPVSNVKFIKHRIGQ